MGLIILAIICAAVAVVIATASGGGDPGDQATQATPPESSTDSEEQPHETVPPEPVVTRIEIRGGEVAGGPADIEVTKGDAVRIVVSSDAADNLHLHGYDIERKAAPGRPARFKFTADVEGIFEIESHVAEDVGRDPLIAKLTVEPS